jgi:hypothetical protein
VPLIALTRAVVARWHRLGCWLGVSLGLRAPGGFEAPVQCFKLAHLIVHGVAGLQAEPVQDSDVRFGQSGQLADDRQEGAAPATHEAAPLLKRPAVSVVDQQPESARHLHEAALLGRHPVLAPERADQLAPVLDEPAGGRAPEVERSDPPEQNLGPRHPQTMARPPGAHRAAFPGFAWRLVRLWATVRPGPNTQPPRNRERVRTRNQLK